MLEGDDFVSQDANSEASSAPQESAPETLDSTSNQPKPEAGEGSENANNQPEKQLPFHEHPRFKEIIEERRQLADRVKAYEARQEEMSRRFEELTKQREAAQPKQVHPFVAKLKEIDPQYAEYLENLEKQASQVQEVQQWRQEVQRRELQQQYESSIERLHGENKVTPEWKQFYRRQIDAMVMQNPRMGLQDLPGAYKSVHDEVSKMIDGVKRAERASYVGSKTKDVAAPSSQTKGNAPSTRGKATFTGDKEADLATLVKRTLKLSKAEGDI